MKSRFLGQSDKTIKIAIIRQNRNKRAKIGKFNEFKGVL